DATVFALAAAAPAEESDLRPLEPEVFQGRLAGGRAVHFRSAVGDDEERDDLWVWLGAGGGGRVFWGFGGVGGGWWCVGRMRTWLALCRYLARVGPRGWSSVYVKRGVSPAVGGGVFPGVLPPLSSGWRRSPAVET